MKIAIDAAKVVCDGAIAVAEGLFKAATSALNIIDLIGELLCAIQIKEFLIDTQLSAAKQKLHFKLTLIVFKKELTIEFDIQNEIDVSKFDFGPTVEKAYEGIMGVVQGICPF